MKPYPWKCATCGERAVSRATLPVYSTELDHDGRTYAVAVEDLDVMRCERCGTVSLDDDASDRLTDALRQAAGLLSPAEIRSGRERLGLSQKAAADFLKISVSTLSRWETGAQIQQRVMDAFLRVFFESREARRILGVPEPAPSPVINADRASEAFAFPARHATTAAGPTAP